MNKIAIIRIRGQVNKQKDIRDTLKMLRLYRKNYCAVVDNRADIVGMIKKVKDYVTYGEIDSDTIELLIEKRGEKTFIGEEEVMKKFFRLMPPRKGFGRKGIKVSYKAGGALGYRGKAINELIKRMV